MQGVLLVDVGCDWPEVVFTGPIEEARRIQSELPDGITSSVQSFVTVAEAIEEAAQS